ncbi:hypothetical protein WA026_022612 [Henosepilachna vigintioctopunctata]|uniref:RING-type E3 ubiquitin transferase n=1 Tax=Henosepilachna vigintioctopunctata TaxID=420089 RepID=A0AAW1V5K4_9CUCU
MDDSTKIKFNIGTVGENGEISCSNCKNYLSVGPVLYNSIFGNICGREACALLASSDGVNSEQVLYESVVQFSLFPCRYRNAGCLSEVKWGEVKGHEQACEYKNFACPFFVNEKECDWTGDLSELLFHAESTHPEREFTNSNIIAEVSKLKQERFFLNISQNIVLIMLYLEESKNILHCKIWGSEHTRKVLTYQIKFIDKTTLKSISTTLREVGILHPTVLEDIKQNYTEIDLNTMRNLLADIFYFEIDFRFNNTKVEIKKSDLLKPSISLDFSEKKSNLLLCKYCEPKNAKSAKYDLSNGAICENCLGSRRSEGSDYSLAPSIQNKLLILADRPCKNSSRGCDYVSSYFSIRTHQDSCQYAEKTCIICNIPVENLLTHAKEHHTIITNRTGNILQLSMLSKAKYVIHFDGHVFFLCFQMNNHRNLTYQVDCAGIWEVRYTYELELLANGEQHCGIALRNICYPGEISFEKYKISSHLSKQMEIPYVTLQKFFPIPNNLIFRITISRKNLPLPRK